MDKFAQMVKDYMRDKYPARYRQLIKDKYLNQFCQSRANQAYKEKAALIRFGMMDFEADEIVIKDMLTIP